MKSGLKYQHTESCTPLTLKGDRLKVFDLREGYFVMAHMSFKFKWQFAAAFLLIAGALKIYIVVPNGFHYLAVIRTLCKVLQGCPQSI